MRIRLGEAGERLLAVVVLLAIGGVNEEPGGEMLGIAASLEEG